MVHPSSVIRPPATAPPANIPEYCPQLIGTGPMLIGQYLNLLVYVWRRDGQSFWMYPIMLCNNVVIAYIWNGLDWQVYCMPADEIDSLY